MEVGSGGENDGRNVGTRHAVYEPQDIRKYERSHQEAVGLGRAMVKFKPMCMWSILAGNEATTTHAMYVDTYVHMHNPTYYSRYVRMHVVYVKFAVVALLCVKFHVASPLPHVIIPYQTPLLCTFSKSQGGKIFIGLNINFTKRNEELLGYSRYQEDRGWSFSEAAVDILKEFKQKFPSVFDHLEQHPSDELYYEEDLFPDKGDR